MEPSTAEPRTTDRRARRDPLTRQGILDRALAVIDRDGLEGLSMRRLAGELDVSAMSLYNHVPNKEALLEGVTEALMGEIDVSAVERQDWAEAIREGFHSFRRVLLSHPNAFSLIQTKRVVTAEALRPSELSLATLRRAGFDAEDALKAHRLLVGFTVGHVGYQLMDPFRDEPGSGPSGAPALEQQLGADEFGNLFECLHRSGDPEFDDAAYSFGLDAIIDGLKARLTTAVAHRYHA